MEIRITADTYWEALRNLRAILEKEGSLLVCYGASLNVAPSGMQLDMGSGAHAYKLTLGQRGRLKDVVYIFDTGADVIPATVAEQSDFYNRWLQSTDPALNSEIQ